MTEFAVQGHGVYFFRVDRRVELARWWAQEGHAVVRGQPQGSTEQLSFLKDLGAIYVNGCRVGSDETFLQSGDVLRIHSRPKRFEMPAHCARQAFVFENDNFLILNKPSGLPVHPTLDNQIENCLTWVSTSLGQPIFVTHRLDVGTSGLLFLAKTTNTQRGFMTLLQQGNIEKYYSALIEGSASNLLTGTPLVHWMENSKFAPKRIFADVQLNSKKCVTEICDRVGDEVLLRPRTGRTHQLRAQLAFEGAPIVGDTLYGAKQPHTSAGFALRATRLRFKMDNEYDFEIDRFRQGFSALAD